MPLEFDPTRPLAKVTLTSYEDPGETMRDALLNPESIGMSISVSVGEINPVGASASVLQYGHTQSLSSNLELYFSSLLQGRYASDSHDSPARRGVHPVDITRHVNWLASFCFAKEQHRAPSPLLILWPHVLNIAAVITNFSVEYTRFARDLTPVIARVTLAYRELRFTWRGSNDVRREGWTTLDPLLGGSVTGGRLNLDGKG